MKFADFKEHGSDTAVKAAGGYRYIDDKLINQLYELLID